MESSQVLSFSLSPFPLSPLPFLALSFPFLELMWIPSGLTSFPGTEARTSYPCNIMSPEASWSSLIQVSSSMSIASVLDVSDLPWPPVDRPILYISFLPMVRPSYLFPYISCRQSKFRNLPSTCPGLDVQNSIVSLWFRLVHQVLQSTMNNLYLWYSEILTILLSCVLRLLSHGMFSSEISPNLSGVFRDIHSPRTQLKRYSKD